MPSTIRGTVSVGETLRPTQVTVVLPGEGERLVSLVARLNLGMLGSEVCVEVRLSDLLAALGVSP